MSSNRARKGVASAATAAILVLSIPVIGVLVAWPLWYLGTNHPSVYSVLVIVIAIGLVLRGIHQQR